MSSDHELEPNQLPRGQTPIWIQPPGRTSKIKILKRVLKIPELKQYNNNVTVLYRYGMDRKVMKMCNKLGYKYIDDIRMTGAEDQVVILLNTGVSAEIITVVLACSSFLIMTGEYCNIVQKCFNSDITGMMYMIYSQQLIVTSLKRDLGKKYPFIFL